MTENCFAIEDILKFESLEACKGKRDTFGYLARVALKITKIQIFSFREENVHLFGVMIKTLVLSDKNVPLRTELLHT